MTSAGFGGRRSGLLAIVVGMLLAATTLPIGFFADDQSFVAMIEGDGPRAVTPTSLYLFHAGTASEAASHMRWGSLPWWGLPELKVRFFRPLSSALFSLDHGLFGRAATLYHLHSLLWYLAGLLGVALLLRSVLAVGASTLALWLFALDDGHVEPTGWLANRHMLISGVPVIFALAAQIRYREHGFAAGRWLAIVGLALGLLGGEAALAGGLYWLAYEWLRARRDGSLRARLRDCAVPLAVMLAFAVVYKAGGYGVTGSGVYLDPISEPLAFASAALTRVPVLVADLLANCSASIALIVPWTAYAWVSLVTLGMLAAIARSAWPLIEDPTRRALRWLSLGTALSLLLCAGAPPSPRLSFLPGLGASAVLGVLLSYGLRAAAVAPAARRRWLRAMCGLFLIVHLLLSPLNFVVSALEFAQIGRAMAAADTGLDPLLGSADSTRAAHVVVLTAADPFVGFYVGPARRLRAPRSISSWAILSMAHGTHVITRSDEGALRVRLEGDSFQRAMFETLFRTPGVPLQPGARIELGYASVSVLEVTDDWPSLFELRFDPAELRRGALLFIAWQAGALRPVALPAVGASVRIPWSPGPAKLF